MSTNSTKPRDDATGRSAPDSRDPFTRLGWQGIVAQVPESWNLAVVSGDRASGYFRADAPERPRFEVKWWKPTQSVSLNQVLERYVRELQKKSKRSQPRIEAQVGVRLVSRRKMRKPEMLGFTWMGEQTAWGLIWRCDECDRVVMAQVLGASDENIKSLAERVISSMEDHSSDGWDPWGAYGFLYEIPDDFALDTFRLVTGKLEFRFTRGRLKEEFISVCRWGMADVLLKEVALEAWLASSFPERYKDLRMDFTTAPVKGHSGAALLGQPRSVRKRIQERAQSVVRRRSPARFIANAWHCAESNKIFSAECNVRPDDDYRSCPARGQKDGKIFRPGGDK